MAVTPFSEIRVNTETSFDQMAASVAMDAEGDFVITWQSPVPNGLDYGVFGQRYDKSGSRLGSEFLINPTTGTQNRPSVAMDADGDFVVTWQSDDQDGSNYGIYAQRYGNNGSAIGGEFRVNTTTSGNQTTPSSAIDADGDFVVVWQSYGQDGDGDGVYAQRYGNNGSAIGGEFRVNTATSGNQFTPSVAMDADGDFVVTWQTYGQDGSGYGVYAQRYGNNGSAIGGEFRVNTTTSGNQFTPSVAMDTDGDFVVVWTDDRQDGFYYGVYAQRYGSNGSAIGSEFRVNTTTSGPQASPRIAMDADGDFVVTWISEDSDYGIFGQRFSRDGSAVGSEFHINLYTPDTQWAPSVAMDATGDFVVAWESYGQDGAGMGIYAAGFSPTTLSIDATDAMKAEGAGGTTDFTFTVTRTGNSDGNSSASWAVTGSGPNAADAADFGGVLPTGTVSFTAGQTSALVTVSVAGDTVVETDEGFTVTLSAASGADLGVASASGTIQNDDTGRPSSPPPPPPSMVDGVAVQTGTSTNSDGTTSQTVTIPTVTAERQESVGGNAAADIPLVTSGGSILLGVQVPTGFGLRALGTGTPKTAGSSLNDLIREIETRTATGSAERSQLTGGGSGFLAGLAADTPLLVQTIVPSVAPGTTEAPNTPLVITGTPATPGNVQTALVIDGRDLPSGTTIELQNVQFAAVIGAVRVTGGDGAQSVWGDGEAQYIALGADDDTLHGGGGADYVGSQAGNDLLYGDEGTDTVTGGLENDLVYGNRDDDVVYGNQGADTLFGGQHFDTLFGGQDGDVAYGNRGDDVVYGNRGADWLFGGQGADRLFGGQGDDRLSGNTGTDTLTGGLGADQFVFAEGGGADLITDFNAAEGDRLVAGGRSWTVSEGAAGAVVEFGTGDRVTLADVRAAQVTAAWFVTG